MMEANEAIPGDNNNDGSDNDDESLRFEDLTVDDDLPLLDRVVRYCRSSIALQRLVHVKMLAETAETVGCEATLEVLLPVLEQLCQDPESVIRQHVAAQILPVSVVAMVQNVGYQRQYTVQEIIDNPRGHISNNNNNNNNSNNKRYYPPGYETVCKVVVAQYIRQLATDPDIDVRRSASDALAGLALQLQPQDVGKYILPIPLQLVKDTAALSTTTTTTSTTATTSATAKTSSKSKKGTPANEQEALQEDLRITAANLLAEVGGAAAEHQGTIPVELVHSSILPAVLALAEDGSFRVRRSAAQALPRILGGSGADVAESKILPAFEKLSSDDLYRVRKSTGECLVDMSRSFMILASREADNAKRERLQELRRTRLIPIVERLIGDSSRLVRHGMMQFLGPFIASFYPYVDSSLHAILPGISESDGSNHTGIVAQFFPHASSMVSRLNSSAATTAAPTPISIHIQEIIDQKLTHLEKLQKAIPQFLRASRLSSLSLYSVVTHRREHAPPKADLDAVVGTLLEYFAALAMVTTGDENTDAEMRVYCAYSYPAVALVLGSEHWEGLLKTCFLKLLNPKYEDEHTQAAAAGDKAVEEKGDADPDAPPPPPPLPVKRCLASSLHTVAHILGPDLASSDIMPIFKDYFLRDADDSVRLNVFRNFPSLLSLLKPEERQPYLEVWSEIILGEEFLGNKKRSASNPLVLNWRQRNYLARSLPDLVGLISPKSIQELVWPIIQVLIADPISLVREDTIWAIPMLFKAYCPENVQSWEKGMSEKDAQSWSTGACSETMTWLKENILRIKSKSGAVGRTNFNQRQLFCGICGAAGLALQFGNFSIEEAKTETKKSGISVPDPVPLLVAKFKSEFKEKQDFEPEGPYLRMTPAESAHMKKIVVNNLLPAALDMKDDRIMNVRLALLRVLGNMPEDVIKEAKCGDIFQNLVEEMDTWESFDQNEEENGLAPNTGAAQNGADNESNDPQRHAHEGHASSDEDSSGASSGGVSSDEGSVVSDVESDDDIDEGSYSSDEDGGLHLAAGEGPNSGDEAENVKEVEVSSEKKEAKKASKKDSKKEKKKKAKTSKKESKKEVSKRFAVLCRGDKAALVVLVMILSECKLIFFFCQNLSNNVALPYLSVPYLHFSLRQRVKRRKKRRLKSRRMGMVTRKRRRAASRTRRIKRKAKRKRRKVKASVEAVKVNKQHYFFLFFFRSFRYIAIRIIDSM